MKQECSELKKYSMAQVNDCLNEVFPRTESSYMWIKLTLVVFYLLELAGTITLTVASVNWYQNNSDYYNNYTVQQSLIYLGLVYYLVYSIVGMIGVIRDNKKILAVWSVLGIVAIISHGVLYHWNSSILVTFTTVLNFFTWILNSRVTSEKDQKANNLTVAKRNPIKLNPIWLVKLLNGLIMIMIVVTSFSSGYFAYNFSGAVSFGHICDVYNDHGYNGYNDEQGYNEMIQQKTHFEYKAMVEFPFLLSTEKITFHTNCLSREVVEELQHRSARSSTTTKSVLGTNSSTPEPPTPEPPPAIFKESKYIYYGRLNVTRAAELYLAVCALVAVYTTVRFIYNLLKSLDCKPRESYSAFGIVMNIIKVALWLIAFFIWVTGAKGLKEQIDPEQLKKKDIWESECGNNIPGYCDTSDPGNSLYLNLSLIMGGVNTFLLAINSSILLYRYYSSRNIQAEN